MGYLLPLSRFILKFVPLMSNRLGRYFLITEEEARDSLDIKLGDDVSWMWNEYAGGYIAG
jgi:hypothetical protein